MLIRPEWFSLLDTLNSFISIIGALAAIYLGQTLCLSADDPPISIFIQRVILAVLAVSLMAHAFESEFYQVHETPLHLEVLVCLVTWLIVRSWMRTRACHRCLEDENGHVAKKQLPFWHRWLIGLH